MELHDIKRSRPPQLKILQTYAKLPDSTIATTLPPTVYFSHTQHTLTIFDAYPKAHFHFLVLPRLSHGGAGSSSSSLTDLRALLRSREGQAHETLRALADEAERLRGVIEEEMRARYGFVWDVWVGFHAVPSMEYVRAHVSLACANDSTPRPQTPPLARHLIGLVCTGAQKETTLQLILATRWVLRAALRGTRVAR